MRARADLASIRSYLMQHAGLAANRVRSHLRRKIIRLAEVPLAGVSTTRAGIRILPPTRYPYRIYYTVTDASVVILHIRHTSRRSPEIDDIG